MKSKPDHVGVATPADGIRVVGAIAGVVLATVWYTVEISREHDWSPLTAALAVILWTLLALIAVAVEAGRRGTLLAPGNASAPQEDEYDPADEVWDGWRDTFMMRFPPEPRPGEERGPV